MASIYTDSKGRKQIRWYFGDGRRGAIRIGRLSDDNAEYVKTRVVELLDCLKAGRQQVFGSELKAWLDRLPERLYGKLVASGLVGERRRMNRSELIENGRRVNKAGNVKADTPFQIRQIEALYQLSMMGPRKIGVYFLVRRGVVVYVGKSSDIECRVRIHQELSAAREDDTSTKVARARKLFDSAYWFECRVDELDYQERYWINELLPEYNIDQATNRLRRAIDAGNLDIADEIKEGLLRVARS